MKNQIEHDEIGSRRRLGAAISAVEGLILPPALRAMFEEFDAADLSASDRRAAVFAHFSKLSSDK